MKKIVIAGLLLLAGGQACTEFIEEQLDDQLPVLLSPGMQAQTSNYLVVFRWEPLEHALHYQLQVASPTFDRAAFFYADTVMDVLHFSMNLEPGPFEWRLRALNGSSQTAYVTRSFAIHEGALSKQQVLLEDPPDQWVTAQERVDFSWSSLFGATQYTIQINPEAFTDEEEEVMKEETVADPAYVYALTAEGRYYWQVKAVNDTAQSKWSAIRQLTIDRTAPQPPGLLQPANDQQVTRPVRLEWSAPADAANYQLYVYKSDSVTLLNAQFPRTLNSTTYSFNEATPAGERLLWRVRAADRAGNISGYSNWRSFIPGP